MIKYNKVLMIVDNTNGLKTTQNNPKKANN